LTKNGLGYILGDFFTSATGHPGSTYDRSASMPPIYLLCIAMQCNASQCIAMQCNAPAAFELTTITDALVFRCHVSLP
jgi:hypothetical protein